MIKRTLRSSIATAVLVALGVALIGTGSVQSARAALRERTRRDYVAQMELNHVYTALLEDGSEVEGSGKLLADLAEKRANNEFLLGVTYPKELAVQNTSDVDEYVRVTVYRYWTDAEGRRVDLEPGLIDLNFVMGNGWNVDDAASTSERTVLYYTPVLGGGQASAAFTDSIRIKNDVLKKMTDGAYDYQGVEFHVEAVVDAIQTHHHADAMNGVWGTSYSVSE